MKLIKGKKILKNGTIGAYIKQKNGTWKWRFIGHIKSQKGGNKYWKHCPDPTNIPRREDWINGDEIIVTIPLHGHIDTEDPQNSFTLPDNTSLIHFTNIGEIARAPWSFIEDIIFNSYNNHGYFLDNVGCPSLLVENKLKELKTELEQLKKKKPSYNLFSRYHVNGNDISDASGIEQQINTLSNIHLNRPGTKINNQNYLPDHTFNKIYFSFMKNNKKEKFYVQLPNNKNYSFKELYEIIKQGILDVIEVPRKFQKIFLERYFHNLNITILSESCRNLRHYDEIENKFYPEKYITSPPDEKYFRGLVSQRSEEAASNLMRNRLLKQEYQSQPHRKPIKNRNGRNRMKNRNGRNKKKRNENRKKR